MPGEKPSVVRAARLDLADALMLVVPLLTIFPLRNNDLWWHLASGRWMVAHLQVPRNDPFSHTVFMGQWIDNEWLSQLLIYGAWLIGDNAALILFRVALFAVVFLLVRALLRRSGQPSLFLPAAVCGIALSHGWWALRPSVFSLVALLVLLIVLETARQSGRGLFLLPVLFLLWANLHPGFLFGLLILAGTVAALALEKLLPGWRRWSRLPGMAARLSAWGALSVVVTLFNPYGWEVYRQQLVIARGTAYRSLLDEWAPPSTPFLVLVLVTVVLFLAIRPRRVPLASLVPILGTAALSMTAVRFEEYFALVTIPAMLARLGPVGGRGAGGRVFVFGLLAASLVIGLAAPMATVLHEGSGLGGSVGNAASRLHERMQRDVAVLTVIVAAGVVVAAVRKKEWPRWLLVRWRGRWPATGLIVVGLLAAALALGFATRAGLRPDDQVEPGRYPTRCMNALPREGGRLFNRLSWGGWLIWKAEVPTFIDGRCWGQEIFFEYDRARRPGWEEMFERRGIDWAIVGSNDAMALQLSRSADWETTCEDEVARVFRRRATPAMSADTP